MEYKPNSTAFFTMNLIGVAIIVFILTIVGGVVAFLTEEVLFLLFTSAIALPILIFSLFNLKVKYKKARFVIEDQKLYQYGGSIFSSYQTEVNIKNITNVKVIIPFLQNKIFGTAHVFVESAGSGGSEIVYTDVKEYEHIYNQVLQHMQKNGFDLSTKKLIQEERPQQSGVLLSIFLQLGGSLVGMFFFILPWLLPLLFLGWIVAVLGVVAFIGLLGISITWSIFSYLDQINRRYLIYNDLIVYYEGFLTKRQAIIPMQNVSDINIIQNFIPRLLGLYNVVVSCQGSGQEVVFKHMLNAETMRANIKQLIGKAKKAPTDGHTAKVTTKKTTTKKANITTKKKVVRNTGFTYETKMDPKRTLMPMAISAPFVLVLTFLFPPIFIVLLFGIIFGIIAVYNTQYKVTDKSIEQNFDFIQKRNTEFNIDKVTSVAIKESWLDRIFETVSIKFGSIGSTNDITFKNVKRDDKAIENVLLMYGIQPTKALSKIDADFTIGAFLCNSFGMFIIIGVLTIATVVASAFLSPLLLLIIPLFFIIPIIQIIWLTIELRYSKCTVYPNYMHVHKGNYWKSDEFSIINDIKGVTTRQYPFTDKGRLTLDIAGETIVGSGKNQRVMSHAISLPYVNNITRLDEYIDGLVSSKQNTSENTLLEIKPTIKNNTFAFTSISILLFPLLVIWPIIFVINLINTRAKTYVLQNYRVLYKHGVIYKTQKSILLERIDHINSYQGALNKMFKNGVVSINTAGSSGAEMTLTDMPNHKEFYEMLQKIYK